jgi:hypothetical protein
MDVNGLIFHFCVIVRMNYGPCVDRLLVGDRLAVRRAADGALRYRHFIALAPLCIRTHQQ